MPEPKGNIVTLVVYDSSGEPHAILVDDDGVIQAENV